MIAWIWSKWWICGATRRKFPAAATLQPSDSSNIPVTWWVLRQKVFDRNQIEPPNHNTVIEGSFSTVVRNLIRDHQISKHTWSSTSGLIPEWHKQPGLMKGRLASETVNYRRRFCDVRFSADLTGGRFEPTCLYNWCAKMTLDWFSQTAPSVVVALFSRRASLTPRLASTAHTLLYIKQMESIVLCIGHKWSF